MFSWMSNKRQPVFDKDEEEPFNILVIAADKQRADWKKIFENETVGKSNKKLKVHQCGWDDFMVSSIAWKKTKRCCVQFVKPSRGALSFFPDFVLIRNEVTSPFGDHRNNLYGLMYANIPSVNSLHSIYAFCERPLIQAELNRLHLDDPESFPIVQQEFYSNQKVVFYGNSFPAVVKVGAAHAGYGKMKVPDHRLMEDVKSICTMTENKYLTAEPFINGDFDLRIQKIGDHYRAFKRISLSGTWKTNTGSAHIEMIEMTEKYKKWAEEGSKMFGGLDICTVDAIHCAETGKEYIMEINGTASGFLPDHEDEDNGYVKDLVLQKIQEIYQL